MKISVITVCYNSASTIENTIKSVISQTAFDSIEFIIIDGASTDGTIEIIEKYKDKISHFVSEPDSGIYNAMNKGIRLSTGDYVHFLNSNDTYYNNNVIEMVIETAEKQKSDFLIGDVVLVGKNCETYRSFSKITLINFFQNWFYQVALFANRKLFEKYGLFNEELYKITADTDWIMPLMINKLISKSYIPIPIAYFGLDGVSASERNIEVITKEINEIQNKYLPWKYNLLIKLAQESCFSKQSTPIFNLLNKIAKAIKLRKLILSIAKNKIILAKPQKSPNRKSNKVLFIGHSYHQKTASHKFMIDYLKKFYDVEEHYDSSWENYNNPNFNEHQPELDFKSIIKNDGSEIIIFWQVIPNDKILNINQNLKIIFFPMLDSLDISSLEKNFSGNTKNNLKIISFSKNLQTRLRRRKFNTFHIRYFPKPNVKNTKDRNSVFFWQRLSKINIFTIERLLETSDCKIHIHKAPDPHNQFTQPTKEQEKRFSITYSEWIDDAQEFKKLIEERLFYIAPRYKEGIGMSFLDAMAMGKIVIANNKPTMNEYIKHNKTGFLCNFKNPKPIKLGNLDQIQKNVIKYIQDGYNEWKKTRHTIIDFIEDKLP